MATSAAFTTRQARAAEPGDDRACGDDRQCRHQAGQQREHIEDRHGQQREHAEPVQARLGQAGQMLPLALQGAGGRGRDDPAAHREQQHGDQVDAEGQAARSAVLHNPQGRQLNE
jgi:hypothetical protein